MGFFEWENIKTLILYIIAGVVGAVCCSAAKQKEIKTGKTRTVMNIEYLPLYVFWIVLAVFRYVDSSVGGTDALDYINYFQTCLNNVEGENIDLLFRLFNQVLRSFTDDYHVFFFFYYTIEIFVFVWFINEFSTPESSSIPLSILFFLYLRSFTSMRSNLSVVVLLIAMILFQRKKYLVATIVAICVGLVHVSGMLYAVVILFLFIFKNRPMSVLKSLLIFGCAFFAGTIAQEILMSGNIVYFNNVGSGVYASYARRSLGLNFFENYSVSNLPQLFLYGTLILFRKQIKETLNKMDSRECEKVKMLQYICFFDFIMVPIITILSVYRGYEFLYVVRLVMWGEIIPIIQKFFTKQSRIFVTISFFVIFVIWMIGRIEATYETSNLVPYVFEWFVK